MLANVRFGSKADMCNATDHVRFTPMCDGSELARTFLNVCNSGHVRCKQECPLWARSGHSNVFDGVRSYCPPMLGSDPTRVTEGGFHLPLRASEWGA